MEYEKSNTDEITCPHCDYEFSDSYEYIPRDSDGESSWTQDCPECEKKFKVSFDCRNVDNGYTTHVLECEEGKHNYKLRNELYENTYYKAERDISKWERIEVCTICNKYKFTEVKEDGTEFTKQELLDFKIAKRALKKEKYYNKFDGVKTGVFDIDIEDIKIGVNFKEHEGNVKVWVDLCRFLISKGYSPQQLPDYQRSMTVRLKKDFEEVNVRLDCKSISIQFYQNEIMVGRKKGDGIYEFNKYAIITDNLMKVKMRTAINMCKNYLIKQGFTQSTTKLSDYQIILKNLKVNDISEWSDPSYSVSSIGDRDKKMQKTGDFKYFYDRKVLRCGTIYWNNGNQWYVLCGGKTYYKSHYSLFDYNNEPKRKKLSRDEYVQRIYSELKKAEESHNYDRCKVLWKIIQNQTLYNVWSLKHNSWWGKNNNGYTSNQKDAGVYTKENILENKNYYDNGVDSKAVLIEN